MSLRDARLMLLLALSVAVGGRSKSAAPASVPDPRKFEAYRKLLRKELGMSLPGGNLSVQPGRVMVEEGLEARTLVTTIPSRCGLGLGFGLGLGLGLANRVSTIPAR